MKICPRRKIPEEWLHARVKAVWDKHPDLSYYMIISNEMLFESLLRGLFRAAQTRGIEKMSILLPLVNRCREAQQQSGCTHLCQRKICIDGKGLAVLQRAWHQQCHCLPANVFQHNKTR